MTFSMGGLRGALPQPAARRRAPTAPPLRAAPLPGYDGLRRGGGLQAEPAPCGLGVENGSKWTMMRHGRKIHRLGRPADQRKALLRALTTQLLEHGAIKTTKVKARAVRPWVDKMILLAKDGGDDKRRQAAAWVYDLEVVKNIFNLAAERYPNQNSDFTRMKDAYATSDGKGGGAHYLRRGDAAQMVTLELV